MWGLHVLWGLLPSLQQCVLLTPYEMEHLKAMVGMSYDTTLPGNNVGLPPSLYPKTKWMMDEDDLLASSPESVKSYYNDFLSKGSTLY